MDLVHCQRCGYWPKFNPNRLQFCFSNCGRLLCENCAVATGGKCVCGSHQCLLKAMNQVGKDIKYLFGDPGVALQDAIKKVGTALLFQNSLSKSSLKLTGKMFEANQKMRSQLESERRESEAIRREIQDLKNANEALKAELGRTRTQLATAPSPSPEVQIIGERGNFFRSVGRTLTPTKPTTEVTPFQFQIQNSSFARPGLPAYSPTSSARTPNIFRETPGSAESTSSFGSILRTPQVPMTTNRLFQSISTNSPALSQTSEIALRLRNMRCSVQNEYNNNC